MIAIYIYLAVVVFYTLYIAAINMYRDWVSIAIWVRVAAAPMLVAMVAVDFLMQISLFSIFFLDAPRDLMVTQRLARYRNGPEYSGKWREKIATAICTQALNPFDPTRHHC